MNNLPTHFNLVAFQTLGGAELEVVRSTIPASEALAVLQGEQINALRGDYGAGVIVFLRASGETARLDDAEQRAERAEAALEQLRASMDAHADNIEPKLDSIEEKAAVIGRQLWRGDGLATAAGIVLHELERDGAVQPHTRSLLASAVAAYQAGRTTAPAPADQSALEQLIIAARVAGAAGIWLVRGATAGVLAFGFMDEPVAGADLEAGDHPTIVLSQPHPLIVLIRFEAGDDGESGVEFRL